MVKPVWVRDTVPLSGEPGKMKISGSPLVDDTMREFKVELERTSAVFSLVVK